MVEAVKSATGACAFAPDIPIPKRKKIAIRGFLVNELQVCDNQYKLTDLMRIVKIILRSEWGWFLRGNVFIAWLIAGHYSFC